MFTCPAAALPGRGREFCFFPMRALATFIILPLVCLRLEAQLHDNTWILGYPGNGAIYGHSILTFTDGSLEIDSNSILKDIDFPQNNSAFSHEDGGCSLFSMVWT
ncbi:MAG: hypothetical protein DYG98_11655 [Haliscomenobacteraceae bacterium CHB4]|nr:hypothetical protein [Haliscomenobacteraceae bacterium CHB4]